MSVNPEDIRWLLDQEAKDKAVPHLLLEEIKDLRFEIEALRQEIDLLRRDIGHVEQLEE